MNSVMLHLVEAKLKPTKDRPYLGYALVFDELTDNILPMR